MIVLNRASNDGHFPQGAPRGVQQDIGSGLGLGGHIAFDITGANLQVANLTALGNYAALPVVTDVAIGKIDLMQVHRIKKHSDPTVVIQVTLRQGHIAITLGQTNRVQHVSDLQSR